MIDFYLPKGKLATEVDELCHEDRKQNKENKRKKELEEHRKCTFIRINPVKKVLGHMMGLVGYRRLLIN